MSALRRQPAATSTTAHSTNHKRKLLHKSHSHIAISHLIAFASACASPDAETNRTHNHYTARQTALLPLLTLSNCRVTCPTARRLANITLPSLDEAQQTLQAHLDKTAVQQLRNTHPPEVLLVQSFWLNKKVSGSSTGFLAAFQQVSRLRVGEYCPLLQ